MQPLSYWASETVNSIAIGGMPNQRSNFGKHGIFPYVFFDGVEKNYEICHFVGPSVVCSTSLRSHVEKRIYRASGIEFSIVFKILPETINIRRRKKIENKIFTVI